MGKVEAGWRTSSYSSGNAGSACVETASGQGTVLVRDTVDREGSTLSVPASAWRKFIKSL
jgi:hypothetical protein